MPNRVRRIAPPGMKWCPYGKHFKPKEEFNSGYCRDCYQSYRQKWQQDHDESTPVLTIKKTALRMYGGKCYRCETTDPEVLVLYPPGGEGEKALLYKLRREGWPKGYTITCRNCLVYLRRSSS